MAKKLMGLDSTPKKVHVLRLWWVPCLLAIVCLLMIPLWRPVTVNIGTKSYSLHTAAVTPNNAVSGQGKYIHTGWDGPTGDFTHGEIFGIQLGQHQLRLDIVEDPIGAARRRLPKTLDGLIDALNSRDNWLRMVAMERMKEMGRVALRAIPMLLNRVEQGDPEAEDTLATVCKAADRSAVPALSNALMNRSPMVRGKAAEILGEIGPPAKDSIPLLRARLHDAEPKVVAWSAMSLRKIDGQGEGGVPVLMEMLTNPVAETRGMAAVGLAEFGADAGPALPSLIQCLDDRDLQVQIMVARSIAMIGASIRTNRSRGNSGIATALAIPKLKALALGEEGLAGWAMDALSTMGPDAAPVLAEIYRTADEERRFPAARALMKLGPDAGAAVPTLMADMRGTNVGRVILATQILGKLGENGRIALPQLERLLQNQDILVRVRAAGAIWKLDQRASVLPVLLEGLQDESIHRGSVKKYAAEALGDMGPAAKEAVPLLKTMLTDGQSGLRQAAAEALEKIPRVANAP
jgi:HEAT repeat protein